VRGWLLVPGCAEPVPTDWVAIYETLAQAQRELARSPDLMKAQRSPGDDPSIVETWI
jgi:hypothetical protein